MFSIRRVEFVVLVPIFVLLGALTWFKGTLLNMEIESIAKASNTELQKAVDCKTKIGEIQAYHASYINEPEDELAKKIVSLTDDVINIIDHDSVDPETEEISSLFIQSRKSLSEFKQLFGVLKDEVSIVEEKKLMMVKMSENLAALLNHFCKEKEDEYNSLVQTNDIINATKSEIDDYLALGIKLYQGEVENIAEAIKDMEARKTNIYNMINTILSHIEQDQKIKGLILKRYVKWFYDSVLSLTKESGSAASDSEDIAKAEKRYKQAIQEVGSVFKQLENYAKGDPKSKTAILEHLEKQSNLISEVRIASFNYIITKDPMYQNIAKVKLRRSLEQLDTMSSILENQSDKMTIVDIMNVNYGYSEVVEEWLVLESKINAEIVPESIAKLAGVSEAFTKITAIVERSIYQRMKGVVGSGVEHSNIVIILCAVGAFLGIIFAAFKPNE